MRGKEREAFDESQTQKFPQEGHFIPEAKSKKSKKSVIGNIKINTIALENFIRIF